MKKIIALGITAAFLSGMCASAITVNVSRLPGYYLDGSSAGEFNVTPVTGAGYAPSVQVNSGFETFCFDAAPSISLPGTYTATLNTSGVDAFGLQMTAGAAWLYRQFAVGSLVGYDYTPGAGRASSALSLQVALWNLQGGYGTPGVIGVGGSWSPFTTIVVNTLGLAGALAPTDGNASGVGILDLSYTSSTDANDRPTQVQVQPVYTLLPDGGSALIMLGMALSSLAVFSRKFRK